MAGKKKRKYTARGFRIDEFKDIYGHPCSIQKSSLASKEAIWLGSDGGQHYSGHKIVKIKEECCSRMHLDKTLARWLIKKLTKFVETNEI